MQATGTRFKVADGSVPFAKDDVNQIHIFMSRLVVLGEKGRRIFANCLRRIRPLRSPWRGMLTAHRSAVICTEAGSMSLGYADYHAAASYVRGSQHRILG